MTSEKYFHVTIGVLLPDIGGNFMKKTILISLILLLIIPSIYAQPDEDGVYLPPQYASDATFALVSVNRANLRTAPSMTEGVVVDIATWGERYAIVGIFYTGDMTVIDPDTEEFVFDDPNEREVWYLLETGIGQVWIFGGLVLISNPDPLDDLIDNRTLTAEQQASIDAQLAFASRTLGVRDNTRLRSAPSTGSAQVGIVPFDGRVTVIGRNEYSTWFYVDYNGNTGWVSFSLLATPRDYNAQSVPIIR